MRIINTNTVLKASGKEHLYIVFYLGAFPIIIDCDNMTLIFILYYSCASEVHIIDK